MDWTIHNDYQSTTVGINYKIRLCKQAGLQPSLIRLGKAHSLRFWHERGVGYIPNRPLRLVVDDVSWDKESRSWFYHTTPPVRIRFSDPLIVGIVVEGIRKPP